MSDIITAKRILIAMNFTDSSGRALNSGLRLAAQNGADCFVLHASEPLRAFDFTKSKYVETKETIEKVEEAVNRRMDELWEEGGLEAVDRRKVEIVVRGGKAAAEILATAKAKDADLIILGGAGQSGSTAERVVRDTACAVLFLQ